MKRQANDEQSEFSKQSDAIVLAARLAVRDALIDHKLHGLPIVVADADGNPKWIPADEIVIPELPTETLN